MSGRSLRVTPLALPLYLIRASACNSDSHRAELQGAQREDEIGRIKGVNNKAVPRYLHPSLLKKRICVLPGCSNNCLAAYWIVYQKKMHSSLQRNKYIRKGCSSVRVKNSKIFIGKSSHRKSDFGAENMIKCPVSRRLLTTQLTLCAHRGL